MKQDFGVFLNYNIYEVQDSCLNKSDFSQLCQNIKFDFLTFGGFIESTTYSIEKYDSQ